VVQYVSVVLCQSGGSVGRVWAYTSTSHSDRY